MIIKITYVGILDSVHGMWCGFKPEGLIVEEERLVLYPRDGYILKNKLTNEECSAVWIPTEEAQNDWEEVEFPEEPEELEE